MRVVECTHELLAGITPMASVGHAGTNIADCYGPETIGFFARAILDDSEAPIAAMGVIPILPHAATAWALLSQESVDGHGPLLCMVAKRGLEKAIGLNLFTRIDMLVEMNFRAAHQWAQWLGFEIESTKRNYGLDGKTTFDEYVMYLELMET